MGGAWSHDTWCPHGPAVATPTTARVTVGDVWHPNHSITIIRQIVPVKVSRVGNEETWLRCQCFILPSDFTPVSPRPLEPLLSLLATIESDSRLRIPLSLSTRTYRKERANQTINKPKFNLFNIHSLVSCSSCSCLHPMKWQISCYMDKSENRGYSAAWHNGRLLYFALPFINLLVLPSPAVLPTFPRNARNIKHKTRWGEFSVFKTLTSVWPNSFFDS